VGKLSRLAVVGVLVLAACGSPPSGSNVAGPLPDRLRAAVRTDAVLADLERLQEIADDHDGIRALGTPGYRTSAEFVADALRELGYEVRVDAFIAPLFTEVGVGALEVPGDPTATFRAGRDFRPMIFSPGGDLTAPVVAIGFDPNADATAGVRTGKGCVAGDFAGVPAGVILLVQPGPCPRRTQAENAAKAHAAAIVVSFAQWDPGEVLRPTLGSPDGLTIPVIGSTREVGLALNRAAEQRRSVHLLVHTATVERETANIIADAPGGDANHVLMVGGHLDSVIDGPGINDNGSGTMAVLEIARRLAGSGSTPWKVRFAFWSSEEIGLWGSSHYLDGLSDAERTAIAAYLNFDMLASPNGGRLVYGDARAAAGSDVIASLFESALRADGLSSVRIDVSGASDHAGFEQAGIPTGGLFAGANEIKDEAAAATFGGAPGQDYDACYHLTCDTLDRINEPLLRQLLRAAAYVVGQLASGSVALSQ